MRDPGKYSLWLGIGAACAVWGTAFSLYGAYHAHLERNRETLRVVQIAETVGSALAAAGEAGGPALRAAVETLSSTGAVRAAAVIDADGTALATTPGLELHGDPAASQACNPCHRGTDAAPESPVVAVGGTWRVFAAEAVSGAHLYLSLDAAGVAVSGGDLWGVFLAGLGAVVLLAVVFHAVFRHQLCASVEPLGPAPARADGLAQPPGGVAGAVALDLDRCAKRWGAATEASVVHLEELKQGTRVTREIDRQILASAQQLGITVGEFREHLNGIANSTSDNSTSLIQMSASIDEVARGAGQLSRYVDSTAASVVQMVDSIGEVADRVETLAGETDTTAASMAQIDASTREIEVNARQATTLSGRMAEAAQEGSRAVQESLRGIHSSHEVIQETARAMDELRQASRAIGGVVKIINEINDKTKLLSLNAAIIAAQAGEHGKSFAVVAHEIKNLSDRTASSTGEISRLTKGIQKRMDVAAEAVTRGEGATGSSVGLAEKAGAALEHIRETAQVSHDMTREILRATEEQSRGSQKVMASMQEVNAMVTYIRDAAGEHRSSGESVSASTGTMRELTEQVKLATAEQAEVSRYISDAIAAIDRNLQTMVEAVDRRREDTARIVDHASELQQRGEAEALEVQAVEDSLQTAAAALYVLRGALPPDAAGVKGAAG